MVILGDVPVARFGFGHSLFTSKGFAAYRELTDILHRENCLACARLHQSDSNVKAMLKYVPGVLTKKISMQDLRPLLNQEVSPYICGLSARKIRQITSHFGRAAIQARKAGFDMVQIHGDRMLGSFASPVFNHRTNEYGGSIENRIRFAVEAVKAVRLQAPDLPIDFKLAVRQENPHYGNAGVLPEELSVIGAFMCQDRMPMAVRERYEKSAPPRLLSGCSIREKCL